MRQSKHNVKVRQPEQFLFPGSEPSLARLRLTLGAVAIAARVKRDGLNDRNWNSDPDGRPRLRCGSAL